MLRERNLTITTIGCNKFVINCFNLIIHLFIFTFIHLGSILHFQKFWISLIIQTRYLPPSRIIIFHFFGFFIFMCKMKRRPCPMSTILNLIRRDMKEYQIIQDFTMFVLLYYWINYYCTAVVFFYAPI